MDTTQFLLTVVLTVTTILLIIVGIQLIFVLKEIRKTLRKVNTIIEGFESVGTSLQHGLSELSGFVSGFKSILKIVDLIHEKRRAKNK
ncbi:hypothetical protein HYW87_00960 [Candidatus Roizmanbacteria bacterium]|nr:hypothetical protein [Candidatus Roizmanbacteria bacterium]